MRDILHTLSRHGHRLCCVHLVDAHHCSDPAKFISVLLVTLSTMVQLEMPQVLADVGDAASLCRGSTVTCCDTPSRGPPSVARR